MKFGETFCDWLIDITTHAHTLIQASNKYFLFDATSFSKRDCKIKKALRVGKPDQSRRIHFEIVILCVLNGTCSSPNQIFQLKIAQTNNFATADDPPWIKGQMWLLN